MTAPEIRRQLDVQAQRLAVSVGVKSLRQLVAEREQAAQELRLWAVVFIIAMIIGGGLLAVGLVTLARWLAGGV